MYKIHFFLFIFLISCSGYSQDFRFQNPGGNRFSLGKEIKRTASVAVGDLDNDGDVDVVVANGRHWPDQNEVYLNNGSGFFSVSFPLGFQKSTSYAAELADLDGDGDLDIVVGNDKAPNKIFLNEGNAQFVESGSFGADHSNTRNITLADIDSDGDTDILITNRRYTNEICLNDGKGNFEDIIHFGNNEDSTIDVEVDDIDGDGDQDLILANRDEQQNFVYLNSNMTFDVKIPFGTGSDETRAVAIADMNADGTKDIVTANIGEPNFVYWGSIDDKKTLSFKKGMPLDTAHNLTFSLDIGDVDLDGDMDVVIGNNDQHNAFYLNDGNGKFQFYQLGNTEYDTYDIILGDINNDKRSDIIEADSDALNLYYLNRLKKKR